MPAEISGSEGGPVRIPLLVSPENREETANRDARLINGVIERLGEDSFWVFKRPGLLLYGTPVVAAVGRGVYNWNGDIFAIWGATVYLNGIALTPSVDTTGGVYTFSTTLGAVPQLFLQNGVLGYTYDSVAGLVQVTDGDFPTNLVKGSAYLNGTTYVLTEESAVLGSGINDCKSWDPLNSIIAQIEPDPGVGMEKQLVYVVVFKKWSVEIFYDAGNATGSPLGPVQGAKVSVGCRHQDTIQEMDGIIFWVSQSRKGGLGVMAMESMKAQKVSTPAIDRLICNANFDSQPVYSWTMREDGHLYYALTLVGSNLTLVYDSTSGRWYQWTDPNGNYLPLVSSTITNDQHTLIQHASNGKMYRMEITNYTDEGELIPFDLYTPNYDGGNRRLKNVVSMDFIADQQEGSILQVRCSDDDYQTWTQPRRVDLGQKRPRLTKCGSFRRRALHLHHRTATPFRIQAIEIQGSVGTL